MNKTAMETIHIALERGVLEATDKVARRARQSRSVFVRDAIREHLRRLEFRGSEERDRQGYAKNPGVGEGGKWEAEVAWPAE